MKEIDFLPQWYRDKKRSQSRYRLQYAALGFIVAVMVAWTIFTSKAISTERAKLSALTASAQNASTSQEYQNMKKEFERLHAAYALLSTVDQHLQVSAVLGELSILSGENVKLSRLAIVAETIGKKDSASQMPTNAIRAVREAAAEKAGVWEGNIRFKVTAIGIAADATCVAELIGRLERSPWFAAVTPSYCKNGTVGDHTVSEFELTCYINNYTESQKPATASAPAAVGEDGSK